MSEQWLDLAEVKALVKMSKSAIYSGMKSHTFPLAHKRGWSTIWLASDIAAYIADEVRSLPKWGQCMGRNQQEKKKPLKSAA